MKKHNPFDDLPDDIFGGAPSAPAPVALQPQQLYPQLQPQPLHPQLQPFFPFPSSFPQQSQTATQSFFTAPVVASTTTAVSSSVGDAFDDFTDFQSAVPTDSSLFELSDDDKSTGAVMPVMTAPVMPVPVMPAPVMPAVMPVAMAPQPVPVPLPVAPVAAPAVPPPRKTLDESLALATSGFFMDLKPASAPEKPPQPPHHSPNTAPAATTTASSAPTSRLSVSLQSGQPLAWRSALLAQRVQAELSDCDGVVVSLSGLKQAIKDELVKSQSITIYHKAITSLETIRSRLESGAQLMSLRGTPCDQRVLSELRSCRESVVSFCRALCVPLPADRDTTRDGNPQPCLLCGVAGEPGARMEVWDGVSYHIECASVWANTISTTPPHRATKESIEQA